MYIQNFKVFFSTTFMVSYEKVRTKSMKYGQIITRLFFSEVRFNLPLRKLIFQTMIDRIIKVFYWIMNFKKYTSRNILLRNIKFLRNSRLDKNCLIIANGPSANNIDFDKIRSLQCKGDLEVIVMNYLLIDKMFQDNLNPDYIVLSDPACIPGIGGVNTDVLWKYIDLNNLITITPTDWHYRIKCKDGCLHFNDISLEGISSNILPTKARGFPSLTALKALAIAYYLNYKKIFLLGYDNSWFLKLKVISDNSIMLESNHAVENYHSPQSLTESNYKSVSQVFLDLFVIAYSFEKYFKSDKVFNLNAESYIDTFKKIDYKTFDRYCRVHL